MPVRSRRSAAVSDPFLAVMRRSQPVEGGIDSPETLPEDRLRRIVGEVS